MQVLFRFISPLFFSLAYALCVVLRYIDTCNLLSFGFITGVLAYETQLHAVVVAHFDQTL